MEQRKMPWNNYALESATAQAKHRVQETLARARRLQEDTHREARKAAQQCKACFYFPALGGAAVTTRPCACCETLMTFGSTNTDALCPSCAKDHRLCQHCGGDREMRTGRRQ